MTWWKNGGVPRLLTAESVGAYLLDVLEDLRRRVVSEAEMDGTDRSARGIAGGEEGSSLLVPRPI